MDHGVMASDHNFVVMDHKVVASDYVDVYSLLPEELQNKVKYFALEHPVAKIIKDEIQRLRCDECYIFRDKNKKIIYKIRGIDFFCNEYFRQYKDDDSSTSSVDDDLFHTMFDVSNTTTSDSEDE